MNKRQMYRVVCAYNAYYLSAGCQTDSLTERLSEADMGRFTDAQDQLVKNLIKQAGLPFLPESEDDIIPVILGKEPSHETK